MRLYHRTSNESAIAVMRAGFRDGSASYGVVSGAQFRGVWLSNVPLDENEGARGDTLLALELPLRLIRDYEWIEEGKPYREFLVPAALVNEHGRIVKVTCELFPHPPGPLWGRKPV